LIATLRATGEFVHAKVFLVPATGTHMITIEVP
jgi:hypothetical protein